MIDRAAVRVLHCAEIIKGGTASYLRNLIPHQSREFGAENVFVVVPESQQDELPVPAGVTVLTYVRGDNRVLNALRLAKCTLAAARRARVTVVHVHNAFAGATVRPALWLAYQQARVIYCPHGWAWDRDMSRFKQRLVVWVERMLARLCDKVVCISAHEKRVALVAGIADDRLAVVRNAIEAESPAPVGDAPDWPIGRARLLFVGRFDRQKGVDVLFDALKILGNEAHAVVVGAAVLGDHSADNVPSNVTLTGWLNPEQLETVYRSADVLVVPSRWEGFGLVAAEAMRAKLAVVASAVGGLPEVVEAGVTGILVQPGAVDALVNAIRSGNQSGWASMGEAGFDRFVRLFTMGRLHAELSAVYCEHD